MGNCGSKVDCSKCFGGECNGKIQADNDIVGRGVLASFFVSAVLTFTSIIYGYFSDSLPLWYLNEADAAILAAYCNSSIHVTLTPRLAGSWNSATQIIRSLLRLSDPVAWKPLDRERRTEVVSRFILALSDQQLVTGLAILIGAFASRCTISVCLAWFSSTTHLATLDILRDYFIQNRMVRNFRVGGMVILTILWILGFVYARTHSTNADTFSQSISAMPLQCAVQAASEYNSNEFIDIGLGETFIIIFLFLFYYKRIWELFYSQRTKDRIPWSHRDFFLNLYMRSKFREMNIDAQISQKIIREAVFLQNWKRNKELLEKARRSRLVKSESTILLCYRAYVGSFSSNIPVFLFGLVYGIAQVSRVRWLEQPDIAEDADTMSFGQIVPLLLLTIPVLTAIEIYCDAQKVSFDSLTPDPRGIGRRIYLRANSRIGHSVTSEPTLPNASHQRFRQNTTGNLNSQEYLANEISSRGRGSSDQSTRSQSLIARTSFRSQRPLSLLQHHQPPSFPNSSRSTKLILLILAFFCCTATLIGTLLNISVNDTVYYAIFITLISYYVPSVIWAAYSLKYLRRQVCEKLLEYQSDQRSDSRHRDILNEDEISLREVAISPRLSWHGSFSQRDEAIAVTPTAQSSSPNLAPIQDPSQSPWHAQTDATQ